MARACRSVSPPSEPQKPQLVGHGGGGTSQLGRRLLLGDTGFPYVSGDSLRLLKVVEILPLEIFYQGQQGRILIADLRLNAGHCLQPRQPRRPEPTLPGHQLPAAGLPPDRQGL